MPDDDGARVVTADGPLKSADVPPTDMPAEVDWSKCAWLNEAIEKLDAWNKSIPSEQ